MDRELDTKVAQSHFFIRSPTRDFFYSNLEPVLQRTPEEYRPLVEAFKANLASLVSVAGLPVSLAFLGVANILSYRESVLQILGAPPSPQRTPELTFRAAQDVNFLLEELTRDPEMVEPARQLIRQSLVQTWSIFEALASDIFITLLNNKPNMFDLLLRDERTKRRFQLRDPACLFQEYGFDFSNCLGTILAEQHRVDDVETIRSVFDVLFPQNQELRGLLLQDQLWILFQRRNLIIHRRGIVDRTYLKNTGEKLALGSELETNPADLERYILMISKTGAAMASGLAE